MLSQIKSESIAELMTKCGYCHALSRSLALLDTGLAERHNFVFERHSFIHRTEMIH